MILPLSVLAFTGAVTPSAVAHAAPLEAGTTSTVSRVLEDPAIRESSGLARSTWDRRVLYTHNDSGDSNRVFAFGRAGRTRAVYTLAGATARDWEDISSGPDHTLWIADIGDNGNGREYITVYRFGEPRDVASRTVKATAYDLVYPDGVAHNAEGMMVNPVSGRLFIVSKDLDGGRLYLAPKDLSTSRPNVLRELRTVPATITAASFAPDGKRFALRDYTRGYLYASRKADPVVFDLPSARQAESLEFGRHGRTIFTGSEGTESPVWRVRFRD